MHIIPTVQQNGLRTIIKTDSETVEINKTDKYDGFDGIKTNETENEITVDNGKFKAVFPKQGSVLMKTPYGDVTLKAVKRTSQ